MYSEFASSTLDSEWGASNGEGQREGGDGNSQVHWLSLPVAKMPGISSTAFSQNTWPLRPPIPQEESSLFKKKKKAT